MVCLQTVKQNISKLLKRKVEKKTSLQLYLLEKGCSKQAVYFRVIWFIRDLWQASSAFQIVWNVKYTWASYSSPTNLTFPLTSNVCVKFSQQSSLSPKQTFSWNDWRSQQFFSTSIKFPSLVEQHRLESFWAQHCNEIDGYLSTFSLSTSIFFASRSFSKGIHPIKQLTRSWCP